MALMRSKNSATFRRWSDAMVMSQSYDVFMLNRRVKFRPMPEEMSTSSGSTAEGTMTLLNPTKRMLRDLPTMLKRSPEVNEVKVSQ